MFRKEANSCKWQGKHEGQKFALTLADMDLPLYQPFKRKLTEQVKNLNNLTYKNRSRQYYDSIINWYNEHHLLKESNNKLTEKDLVQSPSICNMIGCCLLAFTKENDHIIIFTPVYSFYINAINELDRKVSCCQLKQVKATQDKEDNLFKYEFDVEDFQKKMNEQKPRLIILSNPHNPTGKIFSRKELQIIIKKASQIGAYILSDQIMGDFTLYPAYKEKTQFVSLVNFDYEKIIVGNSLSKVFNFQSVQAGYGIIKSEPVRNRYNMIAQKVFKFMTNQFTLILTPIAYSQEGKQWIQLANSKIQSNQNLLIQHFKNEKVLKIFQLESSYLMAIEFDFSSLSKKLDQQNFKISNKAVSGVLEKYGIYLVDIQGYFSPASQKNIFRVSIALFQNNQFEKFLGKFKEAIKELKSMYGEKEDDGKLELLKKSKL